jgi:hypothetical protein
MAATWIFERLGITRRWAQEASLAALALVTGFTLMPALIFLAGSTALGRYEGASLGRLYGSLAGGLAAGSVASWIVVLGPFGFYLLFKVLRLWWRLSARLG